MMKSIYLSAWWVLLVGCNQPNDSSSENDIIRGTVDKDGKFSGVVEVHTSTSICSGALIDDTHVLTAAHCMCSCSYGIKNSCSCDYTVNVNIVIPDHAPESIKGTVNVNPGFFWYTDRELEEVCTAQNELLDSGADIALVTLSSKPTLPVETIPLPNSASEIGDSVYIVGFGRSSCLFNVGVGVRRYAENSIAGQSSESPPDKLVIKRSGGGVPWHGDSGGPLIDRTLGGVIVGVTSRGDCWEEASYTNVLRYMDWINRTKNECDGKVHCCGEVNCVDLMTDVEHCGTCGTRCSAGQACINGTCRAPSCTPNWFCTAYSACSNETKTRTCMDLNHCGTTAGKPPESASCPKRVNIRRLYGSNGQGCSNPTADWDHCHAIYTSTTCLVGQSASLGYQKKIHQLTISSG